MTIYTCGLTTAQRQQLQCRLRVAVETTNHPGAKNDLNHWVMARVCSDALGYVEEVIRRKFSEELPPDVTAA